MEDNIQEMYVRAREAFKTVEYWPQERVDEMVAAVGWEWQKDETAQALARLAVDESGIGVYEHKVAKIKSKTRGSLWDMRDGTLLASARLHGQIVHLLMDHERLYAASDLGSQLVWDLSALHQDYCALMRHLWEAVPVVWQSGQTLERPAGVSTKGVTGRVRAGVLKADRAHVIAKRAPRVQLCVAHATEGNATPQQKQQQQQQQLNDDRCHARVVDGLHRIG